jgi:LacI family transcriptional regulator
MNSAFGKRATIYDLARLVRVSPGTISRVLNNRGRVKPETRENVLKAAAKLNLKPQVAVRCREVAIISAPAFPDRLGGYSATLTAYLAFALSKRNIGVLLPANPAVEIATMFLDAVVVVTQDRSLKPLLTEIQERVPVIHIDKFPAGDKEHAVCSDHYGAGLLAGRHLIERGVRKPALVGVDVPAFVERLKGFKKAIVDAGLEPEPALLTLHAPDADASTSIARVVRGGSDGIYAPGSSYEGIECLHVLTYVMGLRVPQDISLVGGENQNVSSLVTPPLTTIEEPLREIAEQTATLLDKITSGERLPHRRIQLPVRLIERNSVR